MSITASGLFSGERCLDFPSLQQRAAMAASALHDIGVWQGDIVALLLRNDFAFFEASLAARLLGASTVPLNWHLTADEIGYILDDCGAKVLVAHADLLTEGVLAVAGNQEIVAVTTPPEIAAAYALPEAARNTRLPVATWSSWIEAYPPWHKAPRQVVGPMFYTSGTTGRPKGVKRKPVAPDVAHRAESRSRYAWGLEQSDVRTVVTGPLYHSAPNAYATMVASGSGAVVLQPRFDALRVLELIERFRITHLHVVPTMFVRLLALSQSERMRFDLSSLTHVSHGAAPCAREIKAAMIDWLGPILHEYYAMTETGIIATSDSRTWQAKPGCVGRAVPGIELRVTDDTGSPLKPGEVGEICVKSEVTSKVAYHRAPDKTEALRRGDFLATGDVGWIDGDGVLFLSDRKSDMVISGGVNLYPTEVENALLGLPGVSDCAAFGVPHPEFGEEMVLVVEAATEITPRCINERLASLAGFKRPRRVFRIERMPREDSGKIMKRILRAQVVGSKLSVLV